MYVPYFVIPILDTPTGLKQQPTPLICATLSLLTDTLVLFLQKCFQEKGRTSHTFVFLVLSAGLRYPLPMGIQNLTLAVLSVNFLVMHWGVGTIKSKMSYCAVFLSCVMLF